MITFLLQVFLKPVIEDKNMELARKCSEIISDVSSGDCLHPYICISLSSGFIFVIYFFQVCIVQRVPIQGSNIEAHKIIEKQSPLWYLKLSAAKGWALQSIWTLWSIGPRKENVPKSGSHVEGEVLTQENTLADFVRKMQYFFKLQPNPMKLDWLEQNWVPVYIAVRREDKNKTDEFGVLSICLWW